MKLRVYKKGQRSKITKNFSSTEFDCQCKRADCKETIIDLEHVERLQELRDKLNTSISVNSAYRCKAHNKAVGGASRSRHLVSDATDITVKRMDQEHVAAAAEELFDGIGRYDTFTHVDSRGYPARWNFRRRK
jgi:uncharacterized protein YcbK (DUF882 family)